jgi:hypothetical protein
MAKRSFWMDNQNGDFTNSGDDTFDPTKGYVGIRLQQGVPLLDRDWNELEDIRRHQDMTFRKHYIGDGFSLHDDFKIVALSTPGNDFQIKRGRYLLEGFDVDNPSDKNFSSQTDKFPATLSIPGSGTTRTDAVYLEVWIKEISRETTGVDVNPTLANTNDINMWTCVRHKLAWTVNVAEGSSTAPESDQYFHRSLLATITRNGPVISQNEISDKRSRLRTFIPGDDGRLQVNGPLDGGLSVKGGLIVEDGNVGIGTVDPQAKLHVAGDLKVNSGATIDGNVAIGITTSHPSDLNVAGDLTVEGTLTIKQLKIGDFVIYIAATAQKPGDMQHTNVLMIKAGSEDAIFIPNYHLDHVWHGIN